MALDQSVIDATTASFLQRFTASSNQSLEHAAAVSAQALNDVQFLASKTRQNYNVVSDLVLNRIISDQTGTDDVANERILTARDVEAQPQQQTYNDPNYRGGALSPGKPIPSTGVTTSG